MMNVFPLFTTAGLNAPFASNIPGRGERIGRWSLSRCQAPSGAANTIAKATIECGEKRIRLA